MSRQIKLKVGDRAPFLIGVGADERFYSSDAQAGRAAILVRLPVATPQAAKDMAALLASAEPEAAAHGADLVFLVPQSSRLAAVLNDDLTIRRLTVFVADPAGLAAWDPSGEPMLVLIDRNGRIMEVAEISSPGDIAQVCRRFAPALRSPAPTIRTAAAPVLIIPNVAPQPLCRALIDLFEASPHKQGAMASLKDGEAAAKHDESKKRRRDFELKPGAPLHSAVVEILADRCVPEIKKAFQSDITFADRILLARYDDTGGYFKRHRDNGAPHTAFREFAISINLNTGDYEGGELLFPEFDDDRYAPPAGAAAIFSASLLHEAAPVLKGRRYVLLSFLCSAAGQAKMIAAA